MYLFIDEPNLANEFAFAEPSWKIIQLHCNLFKSLRGNEDDKNSVAIIKSWCIDFHIALKFEVKEFSLSKQELKILLQQYKGKSPKSSMMYEEMPFFTR